MAIVLFSHNAAAYNSAAAMLVENGKAAVIHPTGTGRSFIGFKLCEDNPDKSICWLSPSRRIFETQLENLKSASDGWSPENIRFFTYSELTEMSAEQIQEIAPDYIILDDFYSCGAEMWGSGVQRLLGAFEDVPVLGLSAAAVSCPDASDDLFDGNTASEMTLGEAVVRGILNSPKYILSIYSYSKDLEKYEKRVNSADCKAVRDEANAYLEALRRALENVEGPDVLFDKYMTDRHGKYIVFTPNYETMQEYLKLSDDWFGRIGRNAHIYSAYPDAPDADRSLCDFKSDDSDCLRLLYCIDTLCECVRAEDISGVILIRPAASSIICKQQLGCALSASGSKETVIFDIVDNIENAYSIDSVREEMRNAAEYCRSHGCADMIVSDSLEVIDKLTECKELFRRLEDTMTAAWNIMWDKYYSAAAEYHNAHQSLNVNAQYVTDDGVRLGQWLAQLRVYRKSGVYSSCLTPERIGLLDKLGMPWDVYDYVFERSYHAAAEYYHKHGDLECSSDHVTSDGIQLGAWIRYLRVQYKKDPGFLTDEQYDMLNEIGMRWGNKYDLQWDEAYSELCEYHRRNKNTAVPAAYRSPGGLLLGRWLRRQLELYAKGQLRSDRIERLKKLGVIGLSAGKTKNDIAWHERFAEAKKYYALHGGLSVPKGYKDSLGKDLGIWLQRQKKQYKIGKLSRDKIVLLQEIGFFPPDNVRSEEAYFRGKTKKIKTGRQNFRDFAEDESNKTGDKNE